MDIGSMRNRIAIQKPSTTKDTFGEAIVTWSTDSKPWALVQPLRGVEYLQAEQMQSGVTHKITMRYQTLAGGTKINPRCRVRFGTRYFSINSVLNLDEKNRTIQMMCSEVV